MRILEYCGHIWDPFLSKDIELLESVQKFASKVWWCELAYNSLIVNFPEAATTEGRRAVLKLSVLYKYLNGLAVIPPNIFAPFTHTGRDLRYRSYNRFFFSGISRLHTQTVICILVFLIPYHCGTICLCLCIIVSLLPLFINLY